MYTPSHTLQSSSDGSFFKVNGCSRRWQGFCSFSCSGPRVLNELISLRHQTVCNPFFKSTLKTYIFLTSVEILSHPCSSSVVSFFVCCSSPPNTGRVCVCVCVRACMCAHIQVCIFYIMYASVIPMGVFLCKAARAGERELIVLIYSLLFYMCDRYLAMLYCAGNCENLCAGAGVNLPSNHEQAQAQSGAPEGGEEDGGDVQQQQRVR